MKLYELVLELTLTSSVNKIMMRYETVVILILILYRVRENAESRMRIRMRIPLIIKSTDWVHQRAPNKSLIIKRPSASFLDEAKDERHCRRGDCIRSECSLRE